MVSLDPHHQPQAAYTSLEQFLAEDDRTSKVVRIAGKPLPLDFRYIDRGSENLTVFFTAAVPKDSLAPRFTGFGISKTLDTNGLHFADPAVLPVALQLCSTATLCPRAQRWPPIPKRTFAATAQPWFGFGSRLAGGNRAPERMWALRTSML